MLAKIEMESSNVENMINEEEVMRKSRTSEITKDLDYRMNSCNRFIKNFYENSIMYEKNSSRFAQPHQPLQ